MHVLLALEEPSAGAHYFLGLDKIRGTVYVSFPVSKTIIKLKSTKYNMTIDEVVDNFELVAGTGQTCLTGHKQSCGDEGLATNARLAYPKVHRIMICLVLDYNWFYLRELQ